MNENLNDMISSLTPVDCIVSDEQNMEISSSASPFTLSLRINSFEEDTQLNKFIKLCEGLIRRSPEYKLWREYIRDVLGQNSCVITEERSEECSVEVHHHIPSLFCVIKAIINKRIHDGQDFCSFDICNDVMELHFRNKIGYVTLISSMHEKFHNGFLTIPMSMITGDYRYFIANYSQFLDDDDLENINFRLTINTSNCNWTRGNYPNEQPVTQQEEQKVANDR